jgi:hypothetical protein
MERRDYGLRLLERANSRTLHGVSEKGLDARQLTERHVLSGTWAQLADFLEQALRSSVFSCAEAPRR